MLILKNELIDLKKDLENVLKETDKNLSLDLEYGIRAKISWLNEVVGYMDTNCKISLTYGNI